MSEESPEATPDGTDGPTADPVRPDRPPLAAFAARLSVRRNALVGVASGVVLAVGVYLVRALELLGPVGGTREYPLLGADGYFALLAFVLAAATALFVAMTLTAVSLVRLARAADVERPR